MFGGGRLTAVVFVVFCMNSVELGVHFLGVIAYIYQAMPSMVLWEKQVPLVQIGPDRIDDPLIKALNIYEGPSLA